MSTVVSEKQSFKTEMDFFAILKAIKKLSPQQQFLLVQIILKGLQNHLFQTDQPPKVTSAPLDEPDIPGWGEGKNFWPEDDLDEFEAFVSEMRGQK